MGPLNEAINQERKWMMRWHNQKCEAEKKEREEQLAAEGEQMTPCRSLGSLGSRPVTGSSTPSGLSRSSGTLPTAGALALEARPGSGGFSTSRPPAPVMGYLTWRARGQCGPRF
mmetsp:Transcript_138543/g.386469  ORF Transcript_138543/g.386469 Transcript_138543/m.386469 type:complete len:114 (-) Transcript_138543:72-413(-)